MDEARRILIENGAIPSLAERAVAGLPKAAEKFRVEDQAASTLPRDTDVIQELESGRALDDLSREAVLALVDSALNNRLIKAPWGNPAWWSEPERIEDLRGIDEKTLRTLRDCAVATIEEKRKMRPNPITAGVNCGTKITRRGRPANFSGHDLACACYTCFYDATGIIPRRRTDAYHDGTEYGPFRDFLVSVMESLDIAGNVDWMLRGACEWMANDDGQPNEHELNHFRQLLN